MLRRTYPLAEIRQEAREILLLGGPAIASQLAQIAGGFADTVMAGRLGSRELAAVALGSSIWIPILVLGLGTLMSVAPTVAHCFGAGQFPEAGRQVRQGLWLSLAVGLLLFLATRASVSLLAMFHVDPGIAPTTAEFLKAVSWGIPAFAATTVLRNFSDAVSMTRASMVASLVGLAVNVAGNWLFMYGKLGLPRLGAVGCGVATAISQWVVLAAMIAWIASRPCYRRFEAFARFDPPDLKTLARLLRLGLPIGACLFMEVSLFAAVALLMGHLGSNAVAGHQIALNVASVTFMVPLGISVAITTRVGQAMGRDNLREARRAGLVGCLLSLGFMALCAILMSVFPRQIAGIYTGDEKVQSAAVGLLYMAAVFQVFDGMQVSGAGALRGMKDTAVPMAITFLAYWVLGLPIGYWLGIVQNRGPQSLWLGLIAGLMAAALLLNSRFVLVTHRPP
jgi:multidrug resistance protein, MATE family